MSFMPRFGPGSGPGPEPPITIGDIYRASNVTNIDSSYLERNVHTMLTSADFLKGVASPRFVKYMGADSNLKAIAEKTTLKDPLGGETLFVRAFIDEIHMGEHLFAKYDLRPSPSKFYAPTEIERKQIFSDLERITKLDGSETATIKRDPSNHPLYGIIKEEAKKKIFDYASQIFKGIDLIQILHDDGINLLWQGDAKRRQGGAMENLMLGGEEDAPTILAIVHNYQTLLDFYIRVPTENPTVNVKDRLHVHEFLLESFRRQKDRSI